MSATWLADALRAGGCKVNEIVVPDWKTRGHTDGAALATVVGIVGHHTAGAATGDLPSLGIVRDGRPDLAGPLANLMLSRAGVWVPIAAGRAWHGGAADNPANFPWVPNGDANGYCIGIEAESAGTGDWTAAQLDAYPRGVAALLRHQQLPASRFIAHKEWAPSRKVDPARWPGDMAAFRATVNSILIGDDVPLTDAEKDDIAARVWGVVLNNVRARDRLIGVDSIQLPNLAAAVSKIPTVLPQTSVNVDAAAVAAALAANADFVNAIAKAVNLDASRRLQS